MEYKGIEYNIRIRAGPNEWTWTIHPPSSKPVEGRITGSRERAAVAAHAAIDRWLKNRPVQSD
jgi:hypothetical protein